MYLQEDEDVNEGEPGYAPPKHPDDQRCVVTLLQHAEPLKTHPDNYNN
jgi:hypothetical protein